MALFHNFFEDITSSWINFIWNVFFCNLNSQWFFSKISFVAFLCGRFPGKSALAFRARLFRCGWHALGKTLLENFGKQTFSFEHLGQARFHIFDIPKSWQYFFACFFSKCSFDFNFFLAFILVLFLREFQVRDNFLRVQYTSVFAACDFGPGMIFVGLFILSQNSTVGISDRLQNHERRIELNFGLLIGWQPI